MRDTGFFNSPCIGDAGGSILKLLDSKMSGSYHTNPPSSSSQPPGAANRNGVTSAVTPYSAPASMGPVLQILVATKRWGWGAVPPLSNQHDPREKMNTVKTKNLETGEIKDLKVSVSQTQSDKMARMWALRENNKVRYRKFAAWGAAIEESPQP